MIISFFSLLPFSCLIIVAMPAHFALNKLLYASRDAAIFPFAAETANVAEGAHMQREVRLPGAPGALPRPAEPLPMRMAAAEWEHLCAEPHHCGAWDAIVACFFVDATPDLLRTSMSQPTQSI